MYIKMGDFIMNNPPKPTVNNNFQSQIKNAKSGWTVTVVNKPKN